MVSPLRRLPVVLVLCGLVLASFAMIPPSVASSAAGVAAAVVSPEPAPARNPSFRPSFGPAAASSALPATTPSVLQGSGSSESGAPSVAPAPAAAAPASPVIRASWNGLSSEDNNYYLPPCDAGISPPDVQVAAGPSHVVEMVNLMVSIWTKQGTFAKNDTLMHFFGLSSNEFISDPKVQYDPGSGHWFATVTDVGSMGAAPTCSITVTGRVIMAVSASSDPTGSWSVLSVPSSSTGECLDQPILGVGATTVIISVNVFSSCISSKYTYYGAQYWVISKADLVAGSSSAATQSFGPYANTASYHPAQIIGTGAAAFLVTANANNASVTSIQLFRVTGTPPSASISATSLGVRTITNPPSAPQSGGSALDTGDFRVLDAAWSAENLWLTLSDGCTPAGDSTARSCVRLIQVNTTTTTITQDFDVGAAGRYYLYPSLRPDGAGNLLVDFGYSSSTDYPGLMAAGRVYGDPLNQLDPPTVVRAGSTDQGYGCSGTGSSARCRYGDYFGAGLDPTNSSIVWAAGEFGVNSGWGTQIFAGSVKAVLTIGYSLVNGGAGYAFPKLTYILDGVTQSTVLTTSATSYAADPGTAWSVPVTFFNASRTANQSSEIWSLNTSAGTPMSGGTVSASLAASFVYFHLYLFGFGFRLSDNATGSIPMLQVVALRVHLWKPAAASYFVDAGSTYGYPALLNQSTANERWSLSGSANGTVNGPGAFAGLYYHQYRVTFDYKIAGGASGPAPAVHYHGFGTNTSVVANATVWADAARPYVYTASLTEQGAGIRVGAATGTVGTITASQTFLVTYGLQYYLSVSVEPASLAGNVSGAGWYDAGSLATLTAIAPSGWKFVGWSGASPGTQATATMSMNGPENVSALFYPGLTIVAGGGGSVTYSYGSTSGSVPAGSTFVLYVAAGTTVTLTAQPSSWTDNFVSWSGGATGSATTASVTLSGPTTVSAAFASNPLAVVGIAAGVLAVILATFVLLLVARRRKRQPPA